MKKITSRFIKEQDNKLQNAIRKLDTRRANWDILKTNVNDIFNRIIDADYNHNLNIHYLDNIQFTELINQNFIQVYFGAISIGVKTIEKDFDGNFKRFKQIIENGAKLIFSQLSRGYVIVILYPAESDVLKLNHERIILGKFKDPKNISRRKIIEYIKILFWYNFIGSSLGTENIFDRIRLWLIQGKHWIFMKNIPKKVLDIASSVNSIIPIA